MKKTLIFSLFLLFVQSFAVYSQVYVTSSDSITCTNACTTLTAHLTGDSPTDAGITMDDVYPNSTNPIGFNFNFYGTNYNSCLIGPNGTICFDTSLAGSLDDWQILGPLAGNATVYNSICGPWCDIDITGGGTITYSLTGTAPFRKYIVSFCATHMYSCTDQFTTTQIILYETTNIIEVHIATKPVCTDWNPSTPPGAGGRAIIGVENATGSASTAAPGRDFPLIFTCTDEAWRFTPDATYSSYSVASIPYAPVPFASSSIYWYNANTGAFLGTGMTLNVCPTTTTTYKAGALGCADTSFGYYTVVPLGIIVTTNTVGTITTCGNTTTMTVSGLIPGLSDTVHYTLNGVPQPPFVAIVSASGTIVVPGIVAGSYTNIYTVQGSCSSAMDNIVVPPPPLTITGVKQDPTICGGATGTITLSGYWPSTTYTINYHFNGVPAAPVVVTSSATGVIVLTGLLAGTYDMITSTGGPCPPTMVGPLTLNNPPIFTSIVSTSNPTYCGAPDGSITIGGLQSSFTYTVNYNANGVAATPITTNSSAGGTITIANLSAGVPPIVYSNITAGYGPCVTPAVGPVSLVNPPPPVVTVDSAEVKTCVGVSVQLHAHATPVGITYSYVWTPPTDLSNNAISNPIVTPSDTGTINYVVSANPGTEPTCAGTANLQVHTIGDFTLNNHDTTICDTILGIRQTVQASVTGSAEIAYSWSPAAGVVPPNSANPVITPPAVPPGSGVYTYVVTGSYAHCPDYVHSFTIRVDTPATANVVKDTICLGMTDIIDFTVPGGASYHYLWSSAPVAGISFSNDTLPNPVITPTTTGAYVLTVNVQPLAAACAITDEVDLLVLPNTISIHPTDTSVCAGQVVQVFGAGDPNFSYQWVPTAGIAVSNILNALIAPDTSATYLVVASFHRCPDIYATLHLDLEPNPTVYLGGNRLICQFDTLHINASVFPPWYGAYSYSWAPPTNLDNTTGSTVVYSGNTTSNVVLTVSTPAGCTAKDSALVTVLPGNFITDLPSQSFCPHQTATLVPVSTIAGVTYHWYPSLYLNDSLSSSPVISPISTTVYTIVATTINGCTDTASFTANVFPDAVINLGDSVTLFPGESYHIVPTTNCSSFSWFPPEGLSSIAVPDPVATPDVSTQYVVTATTENGCVVKDSISIYVSAESILGMPNAFTPGTGDNKEYRIFLRGAANINHFRIYNRWGNLVFETKDINKGWDGSWKGAPQPFGVYIYEIEAVTSAGRTFKKTGNLTLLR